MEAVMQSNGSAKAGTAGGLLFVLLNISSAELFKTALLASVGAVVSFTVSLGLKMMVKKLRSK
jgi:hypothetical protein